MTRPGWHPYFLGVAEAVAARADCRRIRFGAVLVRDSRIISTGYNGAPAGDPGCLSGACPRGLLSRTEIADLSSYDTGPGSCTAIHSEANALLYARESAVGSTLYLWNDSGQEYRPCDGCLRLLRGARVGCWYSLNGVLTPLVLTR